MDFPGNRASKYYFPVTKKQTGLFPSIKKNWYILGLDEVIVDLEVHNCPDSLLHQMDLVPGESTNLSPEKIRELLFQIEQLGLKWRCEAGGTIANSLCNYTHLSGEAAILLGTIEDNISPGSLAFSYVAQTPKALSLEHLTSSKGEIGIAVTCFTSDGERTFGVSPGVSGDYPAEEIPRAVVENAKAVLTSLYCLANPKRPIANAAMKLMEIAKAAEVPVAFGLGTSGLVSKMRSQVIELLDKYVTIAAMNEKEAAALTGESDNLLACQKLLEWVDVGLVTVGAKGLTICGYTDDSTKRLTRYDIRSKSIPEYNRWEYSRLVKRSHCKKPIQVFSHIHPYRGGPEQLCNTSGAGDAALAAILHDIVANQYHRISVPDSQKHNPHIPFLSYSSFSRNAQYGNRVAYEVLRNRTPRLESQVGHDGE